MQKNLSRILIGIQARSTSERLPNKVNMKIGDKTVLEHVLSSCESSLKYVMKHRNKWGFSAKLVLLCPKGDPIVQQYSKRVRIIEGSEHDVLSRYVDAVEQDPHQIDYVVRITADCPLLPNFVITKFMHIAFLNRYDYLSNVYEGCRTALDGYDCEVLSRRMLNYLAENAKSPLDREHVTTYCRENPPKWAAYGAIIGYHDSSATKLSIDTQEDLDRVREQYEYLMKSIKTIKDRYKGNCVVHRV